MSSLLSYLSLGYTDVIMVGGIVIIAAYLWTTSSKPKNKSSTMIDLKQLKIASTGYIFTIIKNYSFLSIFSKKN
jgi:hypothetical protein